MNKELFLEDLQKIEIDDNDYIKTYNDISNLVIKHLKNNWQEKEGKNVYYLSMEFLLGNMFYNNLLEAGVYDLVKNHFEKKGKDFTVFSKINDPSLGNGGLGRLAACYLDSAANCNIPLQGYGIRYEKGLFKQVFDNGYQVELDDFWQNCGDPWSLRNEQEIIEVNFSDLKVLAVPYDMPIIGKDGKYINTLRLWQAEGCSKAKEISTNLYPNDNNENGRILRIRQEYFFSAASIRNLINKFFQKGNKDLIDFPKYNVIQLNDTHPVFAIVEFIRILVKEQNWNFIDAVKVAKETFNYTNHTIMSEALEKWPRHLIEKILPEIVEIMIELDHFSKKEWHDLKITNDIVHKIQFFDGHTFNMANLAVYIAKQVNGVAKIHSEIIKKDLFNQQYKIYPNKFLNVTNGITPRRWLMLSNIELANFLDQKIGKNWRNDLDELNKLSNLKSKKIIKKLIEIKHINKIKLAKYLKNDFGIDLNTETIIFSQVKRIHEYKRQLMTILAVYYLYLEIKENNLKPEPMTFIFGGKAAPGYFRAKGIIKYINSVAELINNDKDVNKYLNVIFIPNYNVTSSEKIIAGTDVSLQVSTAGTEASGTGNMKFMQNGAVTLGTLDGANIEIDELAGEGNNYIFGITEEGVNFFRQYYKPSELINDDPKIKRIVDSFIDKTFSDDNTGYFNDIYNYLTQSDYYLVLHDLKPYIEAILNVNKDYVDKDLFMNKVLENIANSGYFSSDRSIREYAKIIWKV